MKLRFAAVTTDIRRGYKMTNDYRELLEHLDFEFQINKVAVALYNIEPEHIKYRGIPLPKPREFNEIDQSVQNKYKKMAKAAIEAIRNKL
jgi:hypothetical protein